MNIALDVGTHEIRALRLHGGRLAVRRCRAAYAVLDDTETQRAALQQLDIRYAACEGHLIAFGKSAERLTELQRVPCLSLFPDGELPHDNPPVRQMVAALVHSLVGQASTPNSLCSLVSPGGVGSGGAGSERNRDFLTRLLKLQGYTPLEVSATQSLVLAELSDEAFTGIGLSFGAGTSQIGLIHRGNAVAECIVPYAGNWIDLRLARAQQIFYWDAKGRKFLDIDRARQWKEAYNGNMRESRSSREQQLADLHRGMVELLLREAAMKFAAVVRKFRVPEPVTMVVAGGTARIPGFRELLLDVLPTVSFPLRIKDVRLAAESDATIARGALIRAELETDLDEAITHAA